MKIVLLFIALISICFCYPIISDDFYSQYTITTSVGNQSVSLNETIYEWYTGKQRRIDLVQDGLQLKVYQYAFNNTEYIDINGGQCIRRDFFDPWIPFFDWLKNSTKTSTCSTKKLSGSLWTAIDGDIHLKLCFNTANNLPLVMTLSEGDRKSQYLFNNFTSGVPSSSNFQLPSRCYTQPLGLFKLF